VSSSSNSNADDTEGDESMALIIIFHAGYTAGATLIVFALKSSQDATILEEQHQSTIGISASS